MFFSFDGIDGVGKSTQLRLFAEFLEASGRQVVTCRDPGSTALGEEVREILLAHRDSPIGTTSEMLLYMVARAQLVEETIRPALTGGKTVIADRFLLSNVVYQGHAGGLEPEAIWQIGRMATGGLEPDLTFVLDMAPADAIARLDRELDRMERQSADFRQRLRAGFLTEAAARPESVAVIDASGPVDEVQDQIREAAARMLC